MNLKDNPKTWMHKLEGWLPRPIAIYVADPESEETRQWLAKLQAPPYNLKLLSPVRASDLTPQTARIKFGEQ